MRIAVQSVRDREAQLHFTIHDTGIGIAPEKQRLIFEAFSQADSSTTRRYGGTGLGLTISSRLVEMMGGRLWLESEPGRGSAFHFTALVGASRGTDESAPIHPELAGLPALVVDDNLNSRRTTETILRGWNMTPRSAANGPEALSLIQAEREAGRDFALILVDVDMPGMDGCTLVKRLRHDAGIVRNILQFWNATRSVVLRPLSRVEPAPAKARGGNPWR